MLLRPLTSILWNVFLALIPVVLASVVARGVRREMSQEGRIRWGRWLPLLMVWLIFLPNTCYLLTEWRHYLETITTRPLVSHAIHDRGAVVDLLFLTAFYILYSGIGLLTFFLSIWPLDRFVLGRLGKGIWVAHGLFFTLCALGVYLGLVERFNSWDLVRPHHLHAIIAVIFEALTRPVLLALILGFGAILWLLYALFDIWMDGALARIRARRRRIFQREEEKIEHAST